VPQGRYDPLLAELQASGEERIAVEDSTSRHMKAARANFMGDNVHATGDARHHLLASDNVVQATNDRGQLGPMAAAAKAEPGVFGTPRLWGFLIRALEKVRAEFNLSALTYNLRRVLSLRSIEQLLATLRVAQESLLTRLGGFEGEKSVSR